MCPHGFAASPKGPNKKCGFRCALPSRSLYGALATPGNGRKCRLASVGMTSDPPTVCERRKKLTAASRGQRGGPDLGRRIPSTRTHWVSPWSGASDVGLTPYRKAERAKRWLKTEATPRKALEIAK